MHNTKIHTKPIEDFNGHSADSLLPHVTHFSQETCRSIVAKVSPLPDGFIRNADIMRVLNLSKENVARMLLPAYGGKVIRRHMVPVKLVNLYTPRSVVLMALLGRRFSNNCRTISNLAFAHCNFRDETPKAIAVSEPGMVAKSAPLPVQANIHGEPVNARVLDEEPVRIPAGNEVSIRVPAGTMLRVIAG